MSYSSEVLVYIQKIKNYFTQNKESRDYFVVNGDEDFFFYHLGEISQKNFEKNGDPLLTYDQFELIRRTIILISIVNKPDDAFNDDKLFIDLKEFGKFCLN